MILVQITMLLELTDIAKVVYLSTSGCLGLTVNSAKNRNFTVVVVCSTRFWWWWWIAFVVLLTDERCLAFFPAGAIVRDPHHRKSSTRRWRNLNLRRTWVQALLKLKLWPSIWWPTVVNLSMNHRCNFNPHLKFIFEMKIKSKFKFQIDIRN